MANLSLVKEHDDPKRPVIANDVRPEVWQALASAASTDDARPSICCAFRQRFPHPLDTSRSERDWLLATDSYVALAVPMPGALSGIVTGRTVIGRTDLHRMGKGKASAGTLEAPLSTLGCDLFPMAAYFDQWQTTDREIWLYRNPEMSQRIDIDAAAVGTHLPVWSHRWRLHHATDGWVTQSFDVDRLAQVAEWFGSPLRLRQQTHPSGTTDHTVPVIVTGEHEKSHLHHSTGAFALVMPKRVK